jgi:CobQ-like glutamine amidotransferase family enzyme
MNRPLRICHLYPELLGLYGDGGNVDCLVARCQWRGIPVTVVTATLGDPLPEADLYLLGGGQDRQQRAVFADARRTKVALGERAAEGRVVFAVCAGYQLLGEAYVTADGEELPGLGILPLRTVAGTPRLIGDVYALATTPHGGGFLVGFENHGGRTELGPGLAPLARVVRGGGNNGRDGGEGAIRGTVIGTYLHGPVLPKNPWLADLLVALAFGRGEPVRLPPLDDHTERLAAERARRLALRRRPASGGWRRFALR